MFGNLDDLSDSRIIPSMAVMGKTPVWVGEDRYNRLLVNGEEVNPVQLANLLSERFTRIHYLDILGIREGRVEWNLFQSITETSAEIWADVGAVNSDSVIDMIMSGADRPVISTKMIDSLEEIASSFELSDQLILQVDFYGKLVAKDARIRGMTPVEFADEMRSLGIDTYILDDISPGRRSISDELLEPFIRDEETIVFAGVEEKGEILDILDRGVAGAIISCSRLLEGIE
jgi:hypothetical protein